MSSVSAPQNLVCTVVVDEESESICTGIAVGEVYVRSGFCLHAVTMCGQHARQHREFYAERNRRRRRTPAPTENLSHQGETRANQPHWGKPGYDAA